MFNQFSFQKQFWKAETEDFQAIPSNAMYVNTVNISHKISYTFNAMYVSAVDAMDIDSTHILAHNFLNI